MVIESHIVFVCPNFGTCWFKMSRTILIFLVLLITTIANASFSIDSMLGGKEISVGPYHSSVAVGNLTQKYSKLDPTDVKATGNAAELIRLLRRMFGVGIFKVPPLDPFTTNQLKPLVIGPDTFVSGKVLLNSLRLTGAKQFNLKLIELRMRTGRIDFEVDIPKLDFSVNFRTELYLGGFIPISLKGQLRGNIDGLQLSGALQTGKKKHKGIGSKPVYQVTGATVRIGAKDITVRLVNGMHLDTDLLQSVYSGEDNSSLSTWLASARDVATKHALNTFVSLTNKALRNLSVAQANAYLLPEDL